MGSILYIFWKGFGSGVVSISGPYYVSAAGWWIPGQVSGQAYIPGSAAGGAFIPGATKGQAT